MASAFARIVVFVALSPCALPHALADEKPVANRTLPEKGCPSILLGATREIAKDQKLDALGVNSNSLSNGSIYFCKTGEMVVRPFEAVDNKDVKVVAPADIPRLVTE